MYTIYSLVEYLQSSSSELSSAPQFRTWLHCRDLGKPSINIRVLCNMLIACQKFLNPSIGSNTLYQYDTILQVRIPHGNTFFNTELQDYSIAAVSDKACRMKTFQIVFYLALNMKHSVVTIADTWSTAQVYGVVGKTDLRNQSKCVKENR